jgi:hypothetical protein
MKKSSYSSKINRALAIIERCIKEQELNLRGKTVLTEVGTNSYLYTPVIPLLAGASKVIVWAKDTSFGKAEDVVKSFNRLLSLINYEGELAIRVNDRNTEDIRDSDIITNSGNIRPIDASFLANCKPGVVIPLMFEAWELRDSDIDIEVCRKKQIRVAGTWENHPSIRVFEYIGLLAAKLIFESGLEIKENNVWIWSDDDFGVSIKDTLEKLGVGKSYLSTSLDDFYNVLPDLDLLFLSDYSEDRTVFGVDGIVNIEYMKLLNPNIAVVHLYGKVDVGELKSNEIFVYPFKNGLPHVMTETLGYLGLEPILRLQVAGFKVGEQLLSNKITKLVQPIV